jgi:hypothetical protein
MSEDLNDYVPAGVYRVANSPAFDSFPAYYGWFRKRLDGDGTQHCTNYDARKQETTHWIKRPGGEWEQVAEPAIHDQERADLYERGERE